MTTPPVFPFFLNRPPPHPPLLSLLLAPHHLDLLLFYRYQFLFLLLLLFRFLLHLLLLFLLNSSFTIMQSRLNEHFHGFALEYGAKMGQGLPVKHRYFCTFYVSITDGLTDGPTDTSSYRDVRNVSENFPLNNEFISMIRKFILSFHMSLGCIRPYLSRN